MINRIFVIISIFLSFLLSSTSLFSFSASFQVSSTAEYDAQDEFQKAGNGNNGLFEIGQLHTEQAIKSDTNRISQPHRIPFRVMEYNVENFFDADDDSLKDDSQFLPEGNLHWNKSKYWRKMNAIARSIVLSNTDSTDNFIPPALIAMCEVENDSCMHALTCRSLLKNAGYQYIITNSPDERGVDVALLYQPVSFRPDTSFSLRIDTIAGMRPTRDILYVKGTIRTSATPQSPNPFTSLHVFVVHSPSRMGGESQTRSFRLHVIKRLITAVDSIKTVDKNANIIALGDFNDYSKDSNLLYLSDNGLEEVSKNAEGANNHSVKGTYQYRGVWDSLDHIFISESLKQYFLRVSVADHPDLLELDTRNGGYKPKRFIVARRVNYDGFSDHLPLLCDFEF